MNQIFLPYVVNEQPTSITEQFHKLLMEHPEQCRPQLNINQELIDAAEYKAKSMADNDYFSHTNPLNNETPNEMVSRFGFKLHGSYPIKGNQLESLGASVGISNVIPLLLQSEGHRKHLLGEEIFYCEQKEIGVGYANNLNSTYQNYYVILIARGSNE